jgi:hypothetical protein
MGGGYAAEVAVPLWTGFMRKATAGDPAEWYSPPPGIVAVNVCRLSGKRPVEGCYGATYVTDNGDYANSSSVYTEYFVKGTQPDEDCPIHGSQSIFSRVAGWVGGGSPSAPPQERASEAIGSGDADRGVQRADQSASVNESADARPEPEKKKKRGFWSRVFGVGGDDDKDRDKEKKKKNERP